MSTSDARATDAPADVPGWDRIATGALVKAAQAVASEALETPVREVRTRVSDDGRGGLAVTVSAPLALPRLGAGSCFAVPVTETAHRARRTIAERLHVITGRAIARVEIEYTSSIVEQARRVR